MSLDVPASQGLVTITVRLDLANINFRKQNAKQAALYPNSDRDGVHSAHSGQICFVVKGSEGKGSSGKEAPSVVVSTNGTGDELLRKFNNDKEIAALVLKRKIVPVGFVPAGINHAYDSSNTNTMSHGHFSMGINGVYRGTIATQDIWMGARLMAIPMPPQILNDQNYIKQSTNFGFDSFSAPLAVVPIGSPDSFAQMAHDVITQMDAYNRFEKDFVSAVATGQEEANFFANCGTAMGKFVLTTIGHGAAYLIRHGFLAPPMIWFNDKDITWDGTAPQNIPAGTSIPITNPKKVMQCSPKLTAVHKEDLLAKFANEVIREFLLQMKKSGIISEGAFAGLNVSVQTASVMEELQNKKVLNEIFKNFDQRTAADTFLKRFMGSANIVTPPFEILTDFEPRNIVEMEKRAKELISTVLVRKDVKTFLYNNTLKHGGHLTNFERNLEDNQINASKDFLASVFDGHFSAMQNIIGIATRPTMKGEPYEAYFCR